MTRKITLTVVKDSKGVVVEVEGLDNEEVLAVMVATTEKMIEKYQSENPCTCGQCNIDDSDDAVDLNMFDDDILANIFQKGKTYDC